MKKLLALILCVMMFVALIPTAAFAYDGAYDKTDPDQRAEAARLKAEWENASSAMGKAEDAQKKTGAAETATYTAYDATIADYNAAAKTLTDTKRQYELGMVDAAAVAAAETAYNEKALPYFSAKAKYEEAKAANDEALAALKVAKAADDLAYAEYFDYTNRTAASAETLAKCEAAYEKLVPVVPVIVKPWVVVGNDLTGYYSTSVNKDAISDLNDAIENMYNGLAVNQAVFGTAKTLHSLADGMVKDLLADVDDYDALDGTTVDHDDLVTNCRAFLKGIIGAQIENYLVKREDSFMNDDGTVDYKDYLNVYTKAVNDALTSSKAQKGIEAFVYAVTALKMQDAINDKTDDLRDEIIDWNDFGSKWSEFGFSQDIDDLFDLIGGPDEDYTFVDPTGLTVPEALTLDAILNP